MCYLTCLLVFLLTVAASFIQRVSGFGFGIFVMMFFPFFLPTYGESIMLSGLLAGTTALFVALRQLRHIRWRRMGVVVVFNLLASYLSVSCLASFGNAQLKRCLGGVLILIALYFLFGEKRWHPSFRSVRVQGVIGTLSGLMGGMFAMPGPPVVVYCIGSLPDKREYLATMQAFSVVFNVFYTLIRANVGYYSQSIPYYWLVGLVGIFLGSFFGARCFERISPVMLRRIVYLLMLVSGSVALV